MKKIGIFFTINSNYINPAKVFFSSFLYFNSRLPYEIDYHAYKWSATDDISELKSILPNLTEHTLTYPKDVYITQTDNVFHSRDNNVFIASILATDDMLNKSYDYVIHVDLDMLCIKCIKKYLHDLFIKTDWEVAGARESYSKFRETFKEKLNRESSIYLDNDYKFNFGFLILNTRKISKNNFAKWMQYYNKYKDDFRCPDEMYFSMAYSKKEFIPELNYLDWSKYKTPLLDSAIIHFAGDDYIKPFESVTGNKYVIWQDVIHLYWFFSKYANCSEDFIKQVSLNCVWNKYDYFSYYPKSPFNKLELKLLDKIKLDDLLQLNKTLEPEPKDKSIGINNLVVATTSSINYLDATYVTIKSFLRYNSVSKINIYLINSTDKDLEVAIKKFKQIPEVEVIPYQYKTSHKSVLHFSREYVDSKLEILDVLTKEYDYTLMLDSDLLFQGNLKSTFISTIFSNKKIFGVKDTLILNNDAIRSVMFRYINGGIILYKKGNYSFKENYISWLREPKIGSLGKYNEQDFINDCYRDEIEYIQPQNNYTSYHQSFYHCKPLCIHFIGANKPFLDLKGYSNAIDAFFNHPHWAYYIYTYFYPLYFNYVLSISKELSPSFIKTVNICCNSFRYHYYNALASDYLLTYFRGNYD